MKKLTCLFTVAAMLALHVSATASSKEVQKKEVTYKTSLHCKNCAKKISENVSFEKGVKDLKTDVGAKTVTIVFDSAKTDTLKLADAIRKLGYTASVIEYKDIR